MSKYRIHSGPVFFETHCMSDAEYNNAKMCPRNRNRRAEAGLTVQSPQS